MIIYEIQFATGEAYIGKTIQPLERRIRQHVGDHGWQDIVSFREVDRSDGDLAALEKAWIARYRQSGISLRNKNAGGAGPAMQTDEARAKMRASARSPAKLRALDALHASMVGRKLTEAQRAALIKASHARAGKPLSPAAQAAARMNGQRLGAMVKTPEHRAKISAAHRGRPKSPETRAKISAAKSGVRRGPHSDETKAKMAAARNLYWESDPRVKGRVTTPAAARCKRYRDRLKRRSVASENGGLL